MTASIIIGVLYFIIGIAVFGKFNDRFHGTDLSEYQPIAAVLGIVGSAIGSVFGPDLILSQYGINVTELMLLVAFIGGLTAIFRLFGALIGYYQETDTIDGEGIIGVTLTEVVVFVVCMLVMLPFTALSGLFF